MNRNTWVLISVFTAALIAVIFIVSTRSFNEKAEIDKEKVSSALKSLVVPFVENGGQTDKRVRFLARTLTGNVFVTGKGEIVYGLRGWSLIEIFSTKREIKIEAGQPSDTKVGFFLGNDRSNWRTDLSTFRDIRLAEVWDGIDIDLRVFGGSVEKFFTLRPGASVKDVQFEIKGTKRIRIDPQGRLAMETGIGEVFLSSPRGWQEIAGKRQEVTVPICNREADMVLHLASMILNTPST